MTQSPPVEHLDLTEESEETIIKSKLPKSIYVTIVPLMLLFCLSQNPVLGCSCLVVGVIIAKMIWRAGEAQIPLLICGYQWLEVFASVLQAELYGMPVADLYGGPEFETATWLSLAGVATFSAAFGWCMKRYAPQRKGDFAASLHYFNTIPLRTILLIWAGLMFTNFTLSSTFRELGLAIVWNPLSVLRYAAALLLFQSVISRNQGWLLLLGVLGAETFIGFLGFFGSFKTVFYLLVLAAGSLVQQRRSIITVLTTTIVSFLSVGLFWQAIKGDYRDYVNQGETDQTVKVSTVEQISFLTNAFDTIDSSTIQQAAINTVRRIEYTIFFGLCLRQVPGNIPHSKGRLWGEAVSSALMPRIFFPGKKVFNDSDRTNEFSGISVAGAEQGTSIGIGYLGESYIDFGYFGMFLPIAIFGLLVGRCYCWLFNAFKHRVIGIAIGGSLMFSSVIDIASSNAKMLPAVLSTFLIYWALIKIYQWKKATIQPQEIDA